ncbi:MAG: BatD family protein [Chitinophagales bacterium]|nr:BatD family protein [Chitinophagales bacterium]MCZ2392693.1 BatD family protein [Chitinophagales bacterium]
MKITYWLHIIFFSLLGTQLSAQSISVQVSANQINLGESFLVEYSVEGDVQDFQLPDLKGFKVYQSGQSTNVSIVNGKISKSISYNITVVPEMEGEFEISGAKANYKGKTIYSSPFKIKVVDHGAMSNQQGNSPFSNNQQQVDAASDNWRDNIFLIAEANKNQLYVGEQLMITYKLLRRIDYQSLEVEKLPLFNNFLSEEMEIPSHQTEGIMEYKGKKYYFQAFRKVALFATQAGVQTIDPLLVRGVILVPEKDPFFGTTFFSSSQPKMVTFASNQLKLNVLPLPLDQQPQNFSGAVGQFDARRSIQNTTLQKGQSTTIDIDIKGWGNLKAIDNIPQETGNSVEFYPPNISDTPQKNGDTYGGERKFSYAIVPQKEGKLIIPTSEFVYFDPSQKKYISQPLEQIVLNVLPEGITSDNHQDLKQEFISNLKEKTPPSNFSLLLLYVAMGSGVPIVALLGLLAWRKHLANKMDLKENLLFSWPNIDGLPEQRQFAILSEAFRKRLKHLLGVEHSSDIEIFERIKDETIREKTKYILIAFDSAAYSPMRFSTIKELKSLAESCLDNIENQQKAQL